MGRYKLGSVRVRTEEKTLKSAPRARMAVSKNITSNSSKKNLESESPAKKISESPPRKKSPAKKNLESPAKKKSPAKKVAKKVSAQLLVRFLSCSLKNEFRNLSD